MTRRYLVSLGIGWLCAAAAMFLVNIYRVEGADGIVICFLAGMAPTLIALNVLSDW